MTIDEMFAALWFAYPTDLCRGKRGGKQNALKAFKRINPDKDEFYRIMENMKAQIRADRKDKDAYRWPFVSSYLNQARYDDVIESESERKPEQLSTCCIDNCSDNVHGSSFKYCSTHIPNAHSDLLAEAWEDIGINYSDPEFVADCRKYCREKMNKIIGKIS